MDVYILEEDAGYDGVTRISVHGSLRGAKRAGRDHWKEAAGPDDNREPRWTRTDKRYVVAPMPYTTRPNGDHLIITREEVKD